MNCYRRLKVSRRCAFCLSSTFRVCHPFERDFPRSKFTACMNVVECVAFFVMAFLLVAPCQAMSQTSDLYPNSIPQDATVLTGHAAFIEACMLAIAEEAKQYGWRFGNSLLTQSKDWGLIWRIDFETEKRNSALGLVTE